MLTNHRCYRNSMEGRRDRLERPDLPAATKGDECECRNVCRSLHQWRQEREAFHAPPISYHARLGNVKNVPAGIRERQALSNLIRFSRSRDPIIKYDSLSTLMSRVDVGARPAGLEHCRNIPPLPVISGWERLENRLNRLFSCVGMSKLSGMVSVLSHDGLQPRRRPSPRRGWRRSAYINSIRLSTCDGRLQQDGVVP